MRSEREDHTNILSPNNKIVMFVSGLITLRDDFSDEIPPENVHTGPYKIRTGWFNGVIGRLDNARRANIIPDYLLEEVNAFIEKYTGEEFRDRDNNQEDLDAANTLIDSLIGDYATSEELPFCDTFCD